MKLSNRTRQLLCPQQAGKFFKSRPPPPKFLLPPKPPGKDNAKFLEPCFISHIFLFCFFLGGGWLGFGVTSWSNVDVLFDVLVKMLTKTVSKCTNPLKEYFFYQQLKFSYFLSTNFYLLKIIIYLYFFKAWEYLDSCCKICVIF
jgi:hypothetical protein